MVQSTTPTTYYVNPVTGDDTADGTQDSPFKTLTHALGQVRTGERIQLASGTYNAASGEHFPLRIVAGVTVIGNQANKGSDILIEGGGDYTSPSNARFNFNVTFAIEDNVELRGVTVTNCNSRGSGVWIESPAAIAPTIANCTFKNCDMEGVFVTDGASPKILDSVFSENQGYGISLTANAKGEISQNLLQKNAVGINTQDGVAPIIAENTIKLNNRSGIIVSGSSHPILRNNTIEQNLEDGLVVITQAQPDLGTSQSPGDNLLRGNCQYDLQTTSTATVSLVGNQIDPARIRGIVELHNNQIPTPLPCPVDPPTYTLSGRVIDRSTHQPIANLKVEATFSDGTQTLLTRTSTTNASGEFSLFFDRSLFQGERKIRVSFQVYQGEQLLPTEAAINNLQPADQQIEIEVTLPSQQYRVKGQVRQADGKPWEGLTVKALDQDLRSSQQLGTDTTDQRGYFEILYTPDQFTRAEEAREARADLTFQLFDSGNEITDFFATDESGTVLPFQTVTRDEVQVRTTPIFFNAPSEVTINLTRSSGVSEYERLVEELRPLIEPENVQPIDFTEEADIPFLAGETGFEADWIRFLKEAAQLATEVDLGLSNPSDAEAIFYGLARLGYPTTLSELLSQDLKPMHQSLDATFDFDASPGAGNLGPTDKKNLIPASLRPHLESVFNILKDLKAETVPPEDIPQFQIDAQQAVFHQMGDALQWDQAKQASVLERVVTPVAINDISLQSLVDDHSVEFTVQDAQDLGLMVSLYRLCDDKTELAEAIAPQLSTARPHPLKQLVTWTQQNWLEIIEASGITPPNDLTPEDYATVLEEKLKKLYPSNALFKAILRTHQEGESLALNIRRLQSLYSNNESVVGIKNFRQLNVPTLDSEDLLSLQDAHTQLRRFANLYRGLNIKAILDDRNLSEADKVQQITTRLNLLSRFRNANPEAEVLALDYTDSKDIEDLDFEFLNPNDPPEARQMILSTLKDNQRCYALSNDISQTQQILAAGYNSAITIASSGYDKFLADTKLHSSTAEKLYESALTLVSKTITQVGAIIDWNEPNFRNSNVSNQDDEIKDYLKTIDGFAAWFGSQDYCKCEHCRSIFSPAAYFVDLMFFVEKNILDRHFTGDGQDHVLNLKVRRLDLWVLSLTCKHTNDLVPYLLIINEILENYIYLQLVDPNATIPPPDDSDRTEIENRVYDLLGNAASSFRQPFLLPLEKLNLYLTHFDVTRGEIAELLEGSEDNIAAATLKLSKQEEYDLNLIVLESAAAIPAEGKGLVMVAKIGNFYHVRIFDRTGNVVIDKGPDEFLPDETLVQKLDAAFSSQSIDSPTKRELIRRITSTLEYSPEEDSKREFELITQECIKLEDFLNNLYGLIFHTISGNTLKFSEPGLNPGDVEYEESRNDVQLLLKPIGVTRLELGTLIETDFVSDGGAEPIQIQGEKRSDNSVQNDIERIDGLTVGSLDRIHRFVRLWRCLPWSIMELDLVLFHLGIEEFAFGISTDTLHHIVTLLAIQKRFGIAVEELCCLWSYIPSRPIAQDQQSLFDRLFNSPEFVKLDGTYPSSHEFLHPAFRATPPTPDEVDYALHRLLAGLQVTDETLYQLIVHLSKPLGIDLASTEEDDKKFPLNSDNLFPLYRHARLAQWLNLTIPQLSQLIYLATSIPEDEDEDPTPHTYIRNLSDLSVVLAFYDWWKTTDYSLNDLSVIINSPEIENSEGSEAEAILQQLLNKVKGERALVFTDTVFAFLDGVTEDQSRDILAANINRYQPSEAFHNNPDLPLVLVFSDVNLEAFEEQIRELLRTYCEPGAPTFDERAFAVIDGISAEQSAQLIAVNPDAIMQVPHIIVPALGDRYQPSETFHNNPDLPLVLELSDVNLKAFEGQIRKLLQTYCEPGAPTFDDRLFAVIDGISAEQSAQLIAANPDAIMPVPLENGYWLSETFDLTDSLTIPKKIPVAEEQVKSLLASYHVAKIIPTYLGGILGVAPEYIKGLIDCIILDINNPKPVNLDDQIWTRILQGKEQYDSLLNLVSKLLPLRTLFQDKAFDAESLDYIRTNPDLFSIKDLDAIDIVSVQKINLYRSFITRDDGAETATEQLQGILENFKLENRRFYAENNDQEGQIALAEVLGVEVGVAITLHEELVQALPSSALEALDKLRNCANLVKQLGIGGEALKLIVSNDYEKLDRASNAILGAFRAKYDSDKDYQDKIAPFKDKIQSRKRSALTDFLIAQFPWFKDVNDLYHYFLIDVELEGCARTSRLVAAISSVQLYVHRVIMKLEQDQAGQLFVSLPKDAAEEWVWRKNYRVWEANRKVFLYPENWIEPDLRDNKTPLFEELESELLQQEINADTVLNAYATYIKGFEQVAHLKIAGSYHQKNYTSKTDVLHLFGVTAEEKNPPIYYYRTIENAHYGEREKDRVIVWNSWRKIDVQIPVRTVSPIVFQGRLYVFWVEISTMPKNKVKDGNSKFIGYQHKMSLKFTTLRLDGTWNAPQSISLYGVPPFTLGDGVIDDPLIEYAWQKIIPIPQHDIQRQPHYEPKDGYTLEGGNWNRIYPEVHKLNDGSEQLKITGRDWEVASAPIDFYETRVKSSEKGIFNIPDIINLYPFYKNILSSFDLELRYSYFKYSYLNLDKYAFASLAVNYERVKEALSKANEIGNSNASALDWTLDQLQDGTAIAKLPEDVDLEILNGSVEDMIIDAKGDLLMLQGSVSNDSTFLLRRLGTTLSEKVASKLFNHGVEGLLNIHYQQELVEAPSPITKLGGYIDDSSIEGDENIKGSSQLGMPDFKGSYGVYYHEIFFHIPFLIANHLNSQQKFAQAQKWYHFIFDPTAPRDPEDPDSKNRIWQYIEFREHTIQELRAQLTDKKAIETYKKDPFNPHAIARLRLSAYQKCIVMKYIDNLLDWGDRLFAQDTMESINEATLLYVLASDILGDRPAELGECGESAKNTYKKIAPDLRRIEEGTGERSKFLVAMEHFTLTPSVKLNISPALSYHYTLDQTVASAVSTSAYTYLPISAQAATSNTTASISDETPAIVIEDSADRNGQGDITSTETLFRGYDWKTFPTIIRNSRLFPKFGLSLVSQIGPAFCIPENKHLRQYWDRVEDRLFKIRNCMNISGVRRELSLFAPEIVPGLLVRAKAAGLSIEDILNSISGNLPPYRFAYLIEKAKQYASVVQGFGSALLSALEKKDVEELTQLRTVHQQNILELTTQVRQREIDAASEVVNSLTQRKIAVENRQKYYKELISQGLIPWEVTQQVAKHRASIIQGLSSVYYIIAAPAYLVPQFGSPFALKYGGKEKGDSASAWSGYFNRIASLAEAVSSSAGLEASFQRREQEWKHQKDMADDELEQIEKDIAAAEIRKEIAEDSLTIHKKDIEQLQEVYDFYRDKFSHLGLYTWLSTNLQRLYREAYNSAYSMAKLAEQAYRFERSDEDTFIGSQYWESLKAGLLAGERLLRDLQTMERRFIETNYRSLEIDQSFSLTQIDPAALINLKQEGSCEFEISEIYFDLFYPGHYRRKIKSARISIPCITGPYTNVSATLTLLESKLRNEQKVEDEYLKDVPRSRSVAIATSNAQNDAGVFELSFRDERYMPFEGAGAISKWKLSLPKHFRQFDYQSINDVILHISYTAEEDGALREKVEGKNANVESDILKVIKNKNSLRRVFSLRQEFSREFHQLLHSPKDTEVNIKLTDKHFPIFLQAYLENSLRFDEALLVLSTAKEVGVNEFKLKINNQQPPNNLPQFRVDPKMGKLPSTNIQSNLNSNIPSALTLTVVNSGGLKPKDPAPGDTSAIDSEKLLDIFLYLEYSVK